MSAMFDRMKATLEAQLGAALRSKDLVLEAGVAEDIIRALLKDLREPTKELKRVGFNATPHTREARSQIVSNDSWMNAGVVAPWQAMVDEITGG
jgi:hypothetical protein